MSAFRATIRRVPSCTSQALNVCNFSTHAPKMMLFPRLPEFSPFFRLIDEVERGFPSHQAFSNSRSFAPRVDVREEERQYLIQAEVPGIAQDNINVEWADATTLILSGRTEHRSETAPTPAPEQQAAPEEPKKDSNKATVEDAEDEDAPVIVPRVESDAESVATAPAENRTEVSKPAAAPEAKYWVSERSQGSFTRSFKFPARVEHDAVKASLTNGILSIIIPKAQPVQPRRINIE